MSSTRNLYLLGALALLLLACAPAATATPAPGAATATPTSAAPAPVTATATPVPRATPSPTATSATPRSGGTLRVAQRGDPTSWDPHYTAGGEQDMRETYNMVFSNLASVAPVDKPCEIAVNPEIAQSWRWLGDTTFEISVRQGVRFQDRPPTNGRELSADDVAFTIKRALAVPTRGVGTLPKRVKEVKATDRYSVRVTTDGPVASMVPLYLASMYGSPVLSKEWPTERLEGWQAYVGSGPFMLDQYLPGVKFSYSRHPNYWKPGLPYVDKVERLIMPEKSTRIAAMRAGRLDVWYGSVPAVSANELRATTPGLQMQACSPLTSSGSIFMRTDKAGHPLSDVRVRRAISMAVDREGILKAVLQGDGEVLALFPPKVSSLFLSPSDLPPELRKYVSYDPKEARRLLAEAGFPEGKLEITIESTRRYGSPYVELAEAFMADLQKVGINAKVKWSEYGVFMTTHCTYDDITSRLYPVQDPFDSLTRFHSRAGCQLNYSQLSDPDLDALIDRMLTSTDEKQQRQLAVAIQERIIDRAYTIMLPLPYDYAILQPAVNGFLWSGNWYLAAHSLESVWLRQ